MMYSRSRNKVRNVVALVAASLILPALAYARHENDKDFDRGNHWRGDNHQQYGDGCVPFAAEANGGNVLMPLVGVVLALSSLQLLRAKGAQKKGCKNTSEDSLKFIAHSAKIPEQHEDGCFDFTSETGWKVTVFYKRGHFCYVDCFTAPDGQRFEIDGSNPVLWWEWRVLQ
jgi:hypothetical protein